MPIADAETIFLSRILLFIEFILLNKKLVVKILLLKISLLYDLVHGLAIVDPDKCIMSVSYTHLTLPTKRIV